MILHSRRLFSWSGIRVRDVRHHPLPPPHDLGGVHAEAPVRERRVRSGPRRLRARRRAQHLAHPLAAQVQLTQA